MSNDRKKDNPFVSTGKSMFETKSARPGTPGPKQQQGPKVTKSKPPSLAPIYDKDEALNNLLSSPLDKMRARSPSSNTGKKSPVQLTPIAEKKTTNRPK